MSINVNIEVGELDLKTEIGTRVAGDLDEQWTEPITIADVVVEKLVKKAAETADYRTLKVRLVEIRDEEIRTALAPMIAEAFAEGLQKTDTWGSPIGPTQTLREVVIDEARDVLNGLKENRHSSAYDRREPLVRQLVRDMVNKEMRAELTEVIKEEREKVIAAVRSSAAELIAEAVTRGVVGR